MNKYIQLLKSFILKEDYLNKLRMKNYSYKNDKKSLSLHL